jgi:hypothetical protein
VERETNGGQRCPPLKEHKYCNEHTCPRNCKVTVWGSWHSCSKSCANPKPCATGGNIRVAADLSELAGYLENQKMTLEARAYCVGTYVEDSVTKTCSTTSTAYEGSLPIKFAEPNYAPTAEHNTSTYAYLGMLITVN